MNQLITTPHVEIVKNKFCSHCGRPFLAADNFCGECGTACHDLFGNVDPMSRTSVGHIAAESSSVVVTSDGMRTINAFVNNRLAVIGIIAFIGPLGLPALWFSPRFAKRTKITITATYVLLTTIVPLVIAWYWLDYSLRPLVEAFGR
jgi:hypothetical protein